MKLFKNKRLIIISLSLIVALSFGFTKINDKDFNIVKNLDVFYSLFRELNLFYVDDTDPEKLIETGINSMLKSLDPYTVFIPESQMDDFNFMTTGKYGGIGSLIRKSGEYAIIAEPYEGSPAAIAGLQAGDFILSVDDFSTKNKPLEKISENLKGEPNTEVKLLIKRPGKEKKEKIKIIRKEIKINNVSYSGLIDANTGYIRLSNFTFGAAEEVKNSFIELKNQGAKKLILDLRGNPGGLLIEAVRICNIFVPKGEIIVSTKGKVKQWDQEHYTKAEPIDTEMPMIVLVNSSSASASEIVAGALQDLDRAVIAGQRTFGKGLVQTTRNLKYNTQLKVTIAKYYIPSGRCIQALDYTHRNKDGSVGYVPDSLITEFSTKNGRKVFDGGGISPDIKDTADSVSQLTLQLYINNLIFNYATEYIILHPEKPDLKNFSLKDEDYENFKKFVKKSDFSYQTNSEIKLNELIKVARNEKYYSFSEDEILALQKKLKHDNDKDLEIFKAEIFDLLNEEVIGRYYFQKGRIGISIKSDKLIQKSLRTIKNSEKLATMLKPV